MLQKFPIRSLEERFERPEKPERDVVEESRPEPKTADGNKKIADSYITKGRVHEAITRYKKAARMENDSAHRTDLGDAYAYAELPVKALEQYRRAIKKDPNSAEPHFSLGEVYTRYGKWHAAISEYSIAVQFRPDDAFYRYKLAGAYTQAGSPDDAISQMEQAVAITPEDAFYHFELASLYADSQRNDEAVAEMEKAAASNDDYYVSRLGMLYARIGRLDDAAESFREAIGLNPRKLAYRFLLGDIYICQGYESRADRQYDEASKMDRYDADFVNRARRYMQGENW